MDAPHDIYEPRSVQHLGQWSFPRLELKAYGIAAASQSVEQPMQDTARAFIEDDVLAAVSSTGDSNGLGFVIVHPGSLGLSVSAHWWTQGSVLCQRFYRKLYGSEEPLDMSARASIGCVWELGIIEAERKIWIRTMMGNAPARDAYLSEFCELTDV